MLRCPILRAFCEGWGTHTSISSATNPQSHAEHKPG